MMIPIYYIVFLFFIVSAIIPIGYCNIMLSKVNCWNLNTETSTYTVQGSLMRQKTHMYGMNDFSLCCSLDNCHIDREPAKGGLQMTQDVAITTR